MVNVVKYNCLPDTPSQASVAQNLLSGFEYPEFNNTNLVPNDRKSHSRGLRFLGGHRHTLFSTNSFTFGHDVSSCHNDLNQRLGRVRHTMILHYFPKDS